MKHRLRLLPCLLAGLVIAGCDGGASYDDPNNPRPPAPSPIIGTWRVRSYSTPSVGLQQCPSAAAGWDCTNEVRWTFNEDGSMIDLNGQVRTYTLNGTTLTYFGQPAGETITNIQFTQNLMSGDITGWPNVPEKLSLLLEKVN